MDSLETRDTQPQRTTIFWIVLSVLFLSLSLLSSAFAGYGSWRVGGAGFGFGYISPALLDFGQIWDPGGAYLSNGLNLFEYNVKDQGYVGHPGLPVTLMIAAISRLYYWISGARSHSVPYSVFAAKHLQSIILFSRLAMTGFHLLSFYVLFRFACVFLESRRASMIAVVGYATSLFPLIHINTIFAEPFLLIFALLALIWSGRIPMLLSCGLERQAYLKAALAALASVMAFYTKFMLAAPLLVFIPMFILGSRPYSDQGLWQNLKKRMFAALIFVSGVLLLFALGTVLVNWRHVMTRWMQLAPGSPEPVTGSALANAWHVLVVTIPALASSVFNLKPWVSGFKYMALFTLVDGGFILLSLIGLAIYWKAHKSRRDYLSWLFALLILYVPIIMYRAGWHYLVIHFAIVAVFFGYLIDKLALRFKNRFAIFSNRFVLAVSFVLLIHVVSIALVVTTKWSDIVKARRWAPYFTALQEVSYDGRIGLIGNTDLNEVSGMVTRFGSGSPVANAFRQFFVSIDPNTSSEDLAARKIQIVLEVDQDGNVKARRNPPGH